MNERGSGAKRLGNYRLGRRQFLAGSALASAGLLLAGCRQEAAQQASQGGSGGSGGSGGNFPDTPEYNFVFVNHVTTDPIQNALDEGIPVIAYNANGEGSGTNPALAYVGQDLFQSGVEMGKRIVNIVDEGLVALFIATPGQLNIQPRIDGAKQAIEDSGANIEIQQVTTGAELPDERSRIEAWYNGHKDAAGMFAVDAGSTQGVAQVMEQFGLAEQGVKAGGYDLLPDILQLMSQNHIDFTIDQQPYLQGFLPIMQLYLYKLSGGVNGPSETNTGLIFVTPETVDRYLETESRFEGDAEQQKIVEAPA